MLWGGLGEISSEQKQASEDTAGEGRRAPAKNWSFSSMPDNCLLRRLLGNGTPSCVPL